jgi:hypothetical protein
MISTDRANPLLSTIRQTARTGSNLSAVWALFTTSLAFSWELSGVRGPRYQPFV